MLLVSAQIAGQDQNLALPSEAQYRWHEQERIMFVCLDPCTWQGREYDNHSVPLSRINPKKLDTDQWCETAKLWGAKEILFVAKHTGGFCWWQTETTDYGIKDTPYKNGNGDVLRELSESCKKYGLTLGIYVYPGDETWGAGIGSGGQTQDPTKQEAYKKVFRQQLEETLSNYGEVIEVWFDGSCVIDVSDILEKYAAHSVIFQGPQASLRWPGTESGKLFYPAWNTVKSKDFKTGVSTQVHDDPDGDVWAPLETNTTLYDHYWFWSPEKMQKRKSLDELMECYYKSVGYGSVFLLNSSPDTTGLIPDADRKLYQAFGQEIARRFNTPIAGIQNEKGKEIIFELPGRQKINHVVIMEDYRLGHRIREYKVEGWANGSWKVLSLGQSVGRKKIDYFEDIEVSIIKLTVMKNVHEPSIRSLEVFNVRDFTPPENHEVRPWSQWQDLGTFDAGKNVDIEVNLTGKIKIPGQFMIKLDNGEDGEIINITHVALIYDGRRVLDDFITVSGNVININRTAQVTDESTINLVLSIGEGAAGTGHILFKPALIY